MVTISTMDVLILTEQLVACPSITPKDAGALDILTSLLKNAGFSVQRLVFGEVDNLFARYGTGPHHLCYGGHTDVVPAGNLADWTSPPFTPAYRNGRLYGRGVADMKGSVAAFTLAACDFVAQNPDFSGSLSLLITGDEEGPAIDGTEKVLKWMSENGHTPSVALVGEPTNPAHLGQEIKIGRRGSLNATLTLTGVQGHVAYPARADNPCPRLVACLAALLATPLDSGTQYFPPSNLEITSIDVGNPASNVIPARAHAKFNIRFNDLWTASKLEEHLRQILDSIAPQTYMLDIQSGAQSFITQPGPWTELVRNAVHLHTGHLPEFTTSGGTSDARFFAKYCPVVEFGPVNATIHQVDENLEIDVLTETQKIYATILRQYFKV